MEIQKNKLYLWCSDGRLFIDGYHKDEIKLPSNDVSVLVNNSVTIGFVCAEGSSRWSASAATDESSGIELVKPENKQEEDVYIISLEKINLKIKSGSSEYTTSFMNPFPVKTEDSGESGDGSGSEDNTPGGEGDHGGSGEDDKSKLPA